MTPATAAAALREARALGLDRLDAQLLLGHVLGRSRAWLIAHDDAAIAPADAAAFMALAQRRAAGEPLAYLLGEREFHGLSLAVTPAVLVPRPDTETLVDWALRLLHAPPLAQVAAPVVVDLGTGSGAIALAIKASSRATVWAVERSPEALAVAQRNARELRLDVHFAQGDWWQALEGRADAPAAFDVVVANPPYIAPGDPHLAALAHEPVAALVAQDEGLADIARIAHGAPARLRRGGWLLLEHGWQQAPAVAAILARAGLVDVQTLADIEGRPRCTGGRLPG
ncbi:MAG: peptide chain release factor N(5)-glutamine methyltransferase [Burkholderiaceae bacterium]